MKINKIFMPGRIKSSVFAVLILTSLARVAAQTRIMPIGDSITWGKTATDPTADNEGYRRVLRQMLTTGGLSAQFVGPSGANADTRGYFADKARIDWFIADTAQADVLHDDLTAVLAANTPDIVILHIGTNDVGSRIPIGDYGTAGTLMHRMHTLVTRIVDYPTVDKLLLCKIIPKLSTPGEEAQTANFNNALEILVNGLTATQAAKVQVVDMYTPFYANKTTYFTLDLDRVHPNAAGYNRMGDIFYQYIRRIFVPSFTDEFARAAGSTIGNNWVTDAGMRIMDNGESGGGALTFRTAGDQNWDNLAAWQTSENLTTVSAKFTSATATRASNAEGLANVGLAVGLDAATTTANGYLVWVYNGAVRIKTIAGGNANLGIDVGNLPMSALQPGDIFKVSYRKASDANYFTITVTSNGQERSATLSDPNKRAGNGANLYSGVMFRGYLATPYEYYVDNYVVETQLDDNTAPDAPYNLSAGLVTKTTAYFNWTASGNDGSIGTASAYDLRYSNSPIAELSTDPTQFANATIVNGLPQPQASGTGQNFTVTGLVPGTRYYFRMQAIDSWGNKSRLSTEVTVRTSDAGFTVETFNRPPEPNGLIGPDWNIDPTEYTILYNAGTDEGVLANTQTGGWGRVAVYNGRTNPSIVKMVWGENATKDGISMGGLALMLDNSSITQANGYLLFIRENRWGLDESQVTRSIYLYDIRLGVVDPDVKIAETAFTLRDQSNNIRFPQRGDTMTVIMDWFDPQGIKFDVQINGQPASDAPLYDPQKRHNSTVKYAGLMLGRVAGSANNNVTAFYVSSELTTVGGLETMSYPATAKVGTVMSDSLKVLVRDGNNNPLPNTPVWFWVTTPTDASITAPEAMLDPIMIEAEWDLEPKGTYVIKNDKPSASGGKYVVAESGGALAGELDYSFYVDTEGNYWFWGRVIASGNGHYAIQIEVDGTQYQWNTTYPSYSSSFVWSRIRHLTTTASAVHLTRGVHTLKVTKLHDSVPIDKFYITTNGNYQPVGNEYRDLLLTKKDGTAGTVLTLGKKTGPNRVSARAFGSDITAVFTINGQADLPVTVEVQNQNQTGAARALLSQPFLMTLRDQNSNFTPGVVVNFELIQGDGTLTALKDTTDANGQASTYLQLGYGSAPNQVRATVPGTTLAPVVFTGTATSGLAHTLESQVVMGTTKHYINQTYPNFLKARVLNDLGQAMPDVPMNFVVTKGSATVGTKEPNVTNALGVFSDTLKLGAQAGQVVVEARAAGLVKTILVDSVYNYATSIQRSGPEIVTADVEDKISRRTVKIRAWNNYPITPAARIRILFVAKGNAFTFPNGNDSLAINTDNEGYAETLVVPGPIHGKYPNVIEAQATNGFFPLQGSPVKFTIHNESDASRLLLVQGDSLIGVVQEPLETSLQVRMVKEPNSVPIINQPVVFKVESGGGSFIGTDFPEFTDYTNSEGIAEVFYKVGSKTGTPQTPFNNVVTASATNGVVPLDGSPVIFHISAQSSIASAMAAEGDSLFTGTAGKPLTPKVRVKVMDNGGNGVSGEEVIFSVIKGGGTLDGGSDTTRTVLIGNANGIAEITWTLGPKAGTNNNTLQARASNGTSVLAGSPVSFYASGVADSVSVVQSKITAESPRQSTGTDTSRIEVTLLDKFGNPVAGKRVTLSATGGDRNHIYSPIDLTNTDGKAWGYLLSYSAGLKRISASVVGENKTLQNKAEVIFTTSDAAQMRTNSFGTLIANAGTVLRDSLAVFISDQNGNPVAYGPVTFKVKSGGGRIVGTETVMSDSNGIASAWFMLGPNPGSNVVEASAKALDASPLLGSPVTFDVTGKQGQPISMLPASDQVFEGLAGEVLGEPFKVGVIDEVGYPVANVAIIFEVQQGGGRMETAQPVLTNAWGEAVAFFRADQQVGVVNQILARANPNLAGGPFLFEVTSIPGKAYRVVHRSGNNLSGNVNGTLDISVTVTDKYNNPVSGVDITFQIASGEANFNGNSSTLKTSNNDGIAAATVRLGSNSGLVNVQATGRLLEGSPVTFNLYALSGAPANLKRYPASTADIIATKGHELPEPLHVRVEDQYGNPVPGRYVVWAMANGDGQLITADPVLTDSYGVASARFMAGQGSESSVKAMLLNKEVLFTVRQVSNPNFPQLDMSPTPPSSEIFEGDLLNIPLRAIADGDGDALTFELGTLFPPAGVVIKKQSATTAVIQWTPSFDQQGVYKFIIRVVDGRGGFDSDSVLVTVYDSNRNPQIVQTIPSTSDTTFTNGQIVPFWVGAIDPDGDQLHYIWKLDGRDQWVDAPIFYLEVDKYQWGNQTLEVIISDGKVVGQDTRFRWNLDVTTSVQLSQFAASFDPWLNRVCIQWTTSRETDNKGFEVLRSTVKDGDYQPVSDRLIPTQENGKYQFEDADVQAGAVYYYKLTDVDVRGNRNENGPISIKIPKPDKFELTQNYPNPFNPATTIRYNVPTTEHVSVIIYNMMGQRVATLVDSEHEPGYYVAAWDGKNLWGNEVSTGLYIYRLQSETKTLTKRMIKLK